MLTLKHIQFSIVLCHPFKYLESYYLHGCDKDLPIAKVKFRNVYGDQVY